MSPWLPNPAAEFGRARHIAEVLVRNGLGYVVESTRLYRFIPFWRRRRSSRAELAEALRLPARVRRALEELGPTFIKLGQILSTRPDLVPPAYVEELSKLLDAAPPVPTAEIVAVIEAELNGPLAQHFAYLSPEPIASASIGQVHRARLHDGTEVVVKVQRPGIERMIDADLRLLRTQARFLSARSHTVARYGVLDIIEEFSQALRDELDYTIEGRNADRLRATLTGDGIAIPSICWELTTRRVITSTELKGTKLTEVDRLAAQGYDLTSIAQLVAETYLRQVFLHGVFHADPHPANILVVGRQIGLVDFGVVGHLSHEMRQNLGNLLFHLVRQDAEDIVYTIRRLGAVGPRLDDDALRRDVQRLMVRYYGVSLEQLPVAELLRELMSVSYRHQVRLPADFALLARTVVVLEGVTRTLDPEFNIACCLEPFAGELVRERLSIRESLADLGVRLRDLQDLLTVLPRRVDTLTEQLGEGDLTIGIEVRRLEQAMRKLDSIGNRLSFSIVVAALIMGSALVLAGSNAQGFSIPFTSISVPVAQFGFITAALSGAWLLFSIVRSRGL